MDPQEHAELVTLYEQATQDIRTFQDRQTSVTYFTVLVYTALVVLQPTVARSGPGWLRGGLPLMAMAVALLSLGSLGFLQAAMYRARQKVNNTRERFTQAFKDASGPEREKGPLEAWDTLPLLVIVVVVGMVVTVCVIGATFDTPR